MDTDTHTFDAGSDQMGSGGARPPQEFRAFLISLETDHDPVLLVGCWFASDSGSSAKPKTGSRAGGKMPSVSCSLFMENVKMEPDEKLMAFFRGFGLNDQECTQAVEMSPARLFGLGQKYRWDHAQLQGSLTHLEQWFQQGLDSEALQSIARNVSRGEPLATAVLREINRPRLEAEANESALEQAKAILVDIHRRRLEADP